MTFGTIRSAILLVILSILGMALAWFGGTSEGAPVEQASLLALCVAVPLSLLRLGPANSLLYLHVPVVLFLLAEREAQTGLAFVSTDLLAPSFWANAPLTLDTLAGAVLLAAVLASLWTAPVNGIPATRRAIDSGASWPKLLFVAGLCAVAAQIIEELAAGPMAVAAEEGLELAFAVGLVICLLSMPRRMEGTADARSEIDRPDGAHRLAGRGR